MLLLLYLLCLFLSIFLVHYCCACTFNQLFNKLLNQLSFFIVIARSTTTAAFFPFLLNFLNTTLSIRTILQNNSYIIRTKSTRRPSLVRNFLTTFFGNKIGGLRSCKYVKICVLFLLIFIELLL
jgi:hypothetical protein